MTQSDYILQEMLNQSQKQSDHLNAMRQLLIDANKGIEKMGKSQGGGSGSPGGPGPDSGSGGAGSGKFSDMFKNMFGSMKGLNSTMIGGNATSANVLGSLGESAKGVVGALGKAVPAIGAATAAFDMIVDAGLAVYNYLNEQLNMYNKINSAGVSLATGMTTAERGAAKAYMSTNEFADALQRNSEEVAGMSAQYGDGTENFSSLLNSVQKLERANGLFGVSQQQLADLTAKNFKYQKLYGSQDAMRSSDQAASTELFVRNMTSLSKSVGKSVDQLLSTFGDLTKSFDSQTNARSLERFWNMTKDDAADANKIMNGVFASMGDTGLKLQALNTMNNSNEAFSDEFNNQFARMLADRMKSIQINKEAKTPKGVQKLMKEFIQSNEDMLQLEIDAQRQGGNMIAAKFLEDIKNTVDMMDTDGPDPKPAVEEFTKRFNTWMAATFTEPFNTMWANTKDSVAQYLLDSMDSVDSIFMLPTKFAKDLYHKLEGSWFGIGFELIKLPNTIMGWIANGWGNVEAAFGDMMGHLTDIPGRIGEVFWGMVTGDGWAKSTEGMRKSIDGLFTSVGDLFSALGDLSFNYDDMKSRIQDSFEAMKSKISGWWDSAKSWFTGEDPANVNTNASGKPVVPPPTALNKEKKEQPKVVEPPRITKPEKVNVPEVQTAAVTPIPEDGTNVEQAILKALNSIISTTEQTNQIGAQNIAFLQQIAENTLEGQNV